MRWPGRERQSGDLRGVGGEPFTSDACWPVASKRLPHGRRTENRPAEALEDTGIDGPQLTPQGRGADDDEDETHLFGGAKKDQYDRPEG